MAAVDANVEDLREATVRTSRITTVGDDIGTEPAVRRIATHARDVARDAQRIINGVREGVGRAWFAHRLEGDPAADRDATRVWCAAVLRVPEVVPEVEAAATAWVHDQLDRVRVQILNTTGAIRVAYQAVREQTTSPEVVTLDLRANERAATKDRAGEDLPWHPGHLFSDAKGMFPVDLNDWERRVIAAEIGRPGFVAWYRNPGSSTPASLRIAYQDDEGEWASLQPDFIVVSRRDDGSLAASIIDPHGDYLADARAKLHALARFAAQFGDRFVRVESIAKVDDGSLRVLNLVDPAVRTDVLAFQGARVTGLYESERSQPYL